MFKSMFKKRDNPRTRASSVQGKQNKKREGCPLCKISDQALERLRESGNKKTEDKLTPTPKNYGHKMHR